MPDPKKPTPWPGAGTVQGCGWDDVARVWEENQIELDQWVAAMARERAERRAEYLRLCQTARMREDK